MLFADTVMVCRYPVDSVEEVRYAVSGYCDGVQVSCRQCRGSEICCLRIL